VKQHQRRLTGVVLAILLFGCGGSKTAASSPGSAQDRDGDGLTDRRDDCPDQYGPIEKRGCPASSTAKAEGNAPAPGATTTNEPKKWAEAQQMVEAVAQVVLWSKNVQKKFPNIGFDSGTSLFGGMASSGQGFGITSRFGEGYHYVLVGASKSVSEVRLSAYNILSGSRIASNKPGQENHPSISFKGPGRIQLEVSAKGSGFVTMLVMKEGAKYQLPVSRISGSLVNTMKSAGAVRGLAAKKKQDLSFTPNQIRLVGGVVDPGRPLAFGNLAFTGGGPSWFLSGGDRYASDVDLLLFPHDDKKALAIAKDMREPNYASVFLPRPNGKLDFEAKATRSKGPTFISTVIVDQR